MDFRASFVVLVTSFLAAIVVMLAPLSLATASTTIGKSVPPQQRISASEINHSQWDALLKKYVDSQGMVDYRGWKASRADRQKLIDYLNHLSSAAFTQHTSKPVRLAFWINAYNAVTIEGILREYPTSSIRNHTAKLFGYNIWEDLLLMVGGEKYSLENIEHQILRKMNEPRIHFAIVCASIGCPPLRNEAYVPERIEQQLADNTNVFFADSEKFRYDARRQTLYMSPILDWFAEDFGNSQAERLQTIAPYLPDDTARQLARSGNVSVSNLDYDWDLNDQAKVN